MFHNYSLFSMLINWCLLEDNSRYYFWKNHVYQQCNKWRGCFKIFISQFFFLWKQIIWKEFFNYLKLKRKGAFVFEFTLYLLEYYVFCLKIKLKSSSESINYILIRHYNPNPNFIVYTFLCKLTIYSNYSKKNTD